MKTIHVSNKDVTRKWFLIDAKGKPLGRLAAKAAFILQGKHKAAYVPQIDNGDFVIIDDQSRRYAREETFLPPGKGR